jgi:hypothetical protein
MKALAHSFFMQVVNGFNILNGQLFVIINIKCKSDDNGVSAVAVMRILCPLWLSGTGISDFSNVHIRTDTNKSAFASSRALPLCVIFVLGECAA